jgi:hypothetical protein
MLSYPKLYNLMLYLLKNKQKPKRLKSQQKKEENNLLKNKEDD